MAVPKYNELFGPFLKAIGDGNIHSLKEIKNSVAEDIQLSEEDSTALLPSGRQTFFENRISWCRTYLKKAGLIESPARAQFQLTASGRDALKDLDQIDVEYLMQFPSFREFQNHSSVKNVQQESSESKSPKEILEDALNVINESLSDDLMEEIMKLSPTDFEKLVVQLLLKMGYGDGVDDAGNVTTATNDGGIDGLIKEDQLGFSYIYIQAKQWAPERTVDRPEIQKFAGALQGQQASKGLFITTASFSKRAREFADNLLGSRIVLIDGTQLTKLMIKHDLGVSVEVTYELKRIDSDYFSGEF